MLGRLLVSAEADGPIDWPALWNEAAGHRVHLLLARQLARAGAFTTCPPAIRDGSREATREAALIEVGRARELTRMLDLLAARRVPAVLFKGAALAYTRYPAPYLRPRLDADLFVRQGDIERIRAAMIDAGYRHDPTVGGQHVMPQHHYEKPSPFGLHLFDVHWRLANVAAFADTLGFDELAASAVSAPALGPSARVPSAVHSLLIACVHRVAHHQDASDLIWLYDIHLLAGTLSNGEWTRFVELAASRNVRAVCRHSLARARERLQTTIPTWVDEALAGGSVESSAAFLTPDMPRGTMDIAIQNLRNLPRWRDRVSLVREHLFPPADYILARYGCRRRVWLPALYAHRVLTGGARWLSARH